MTVDEIVLTEDKVSLIEGKHSKNAILPSKSDIKDGLLKMILYSNLSEVAVDGILLKSEAVLSLTSSKLKGGISNASNEKEITDFARENKLSATQKTLIETVIGEAKENNFSVKIQFSR